MKDVYQKVQDRKLKISTDKAIELDKKESVAPEKPKKDKKPAPVKAKKATPISERKKEADKIKTKKRIFNFITRRTKKVQVKELEKLSPVGIRELETKLKKYPITSIPIDQRDPLDILKAVVGNEQFTELTGIPSGPIASLEKLDPKIISDIQSKYPDLMKSFEKIELVDLLSEKEKNDIIKKVQKKTNKNVIDLMKLDKVEPVKIPSKKKVSYQLSPASLSNQKYGAIKGFVKELAKEGEPARFWYEQSGKALLDITGGNKEEAKKLL